MPAQLNAHALAIGIAAYRHVNPLPPAIRNEAQEIRDLLADPQRCGYPPDNVQLLLDGEATLAAVRQALAGLTARSDPDSTVFFYFSGHGGRIDAGPQAGEYLLPADAIYTSDQTLAETALPGAELTAALQAIPARKVVVVLDCCHAGGIGQPKDPVAPVLKAGLSEGYYDTAQSGTRPGDPGRVPQRRVLLGAARRGQRRVHPAPAGRAAGRRRPVPAA